uniref:Uncharacterized protein n=1 Tax=Moumouvirus sp. 'Monve' TaxID=1128131 RepID=H2EFF4_9VIRU|nr:hypothetical protein mv_R1017 [Moumouvirus Monve]
MKFKYIPAYNINGTNNIPLSVPDNVPVYSMYTGNIIGFGNIPWGTLTDAPAGHKKHGKKFYIIAYNPEYDLWLAHSNIPDLV